MNESPGSHSNTAIPDHDRIGIATTKAMHAGTA